MADNDLLMQDFERITNSLLEENVGIFKIKQVNKFMREAKERPDPIPLYDKLWIENELCCLFADSGLGKSIFAVQMADKIAREHHRVMYFDFELPDKQFQMRYTKDGVMHVFSDNFFRAEINSEMLDEKYEEKLLDDIEQASLASHADVVIVDNLTWLCVESEKGGDAAKLMKALMKLKFKYNWSMLVVAHTPKRDMYSKPLIANDLAGSRKLFNFFDSVFAIGRSAKDETLRYIKQIKVRFGEFVYTTENVILCSITQDDDGFVHLASQGYTSEREHLREPSDKDRTELVERAAELYSQGKTYREIASEVGMSKSTIGRILKDFPRPTSGNHGTSVGCPTLGMGQGHKNCQS